MVLTSILDPILGPLLTLEPLWSIVIISLILSIFSVLATKFMTNQKLMKAHREEMKKMQKEVREVQKTAPDKALAMQQKLMEKNMGIMKESFKPMLITLIPFLLIFAWLNAHFTYLPIDAGVPFSVTAQLDQTDGIASLSTIPSDGITITTDVNQTVVDKKASWTLQGDAGIYTLQFEYEGEIAQQDLIIGEEYATPAKSQKGIFKKTTINNEPLKVNLLGLNMKWIWSYIIFSLIFSLALRKLLKIY